MTAPGTVTTMHATVLEPTKGGLRFGRSLSIRADASRKGSAM
jgi:hypothetical protein